MLPSTITNNNHNRPLETIFDSFFNDFSIFPVVANRARDIPTMPIDVVELENKYSISADLPGIAREEIEVSLENKTLTISVNTSNRKKETNGNYIYHERKMYNNLRRLSLPKAANVDTISAKLTEGVLTIEIEKTPDTQPKKIEIQ